MPATTRVFNNLPGCIVTPVPGCIVTPVKSDRGASFTPYRGASSPANREQVTEKGYVTPEKKTSLA